MKLRIDLNSDGSVLVRTVLQTEDWILAVQRNYMVVLVSGSFRADQGRLTMLF